MLAARDAHVNDYRRDGKTPYITHVSRVASRLAAAGEEVIALAWLHDIKEDHPDYKLPKGLPQSVLIALDLLTKKKGQKYSDYINEIKINPMARRVKIADIMDNISDDPSDYQIRKYAAALLILV
jgi:hypothetical protein